jgi:hypothetical protein
MAVTNALSDAIEAGVGVLSGGKGRRMAGEVDALLRPAGRLRREVRCDDVRAVFFGLWPDLNARSQTREAGAAMVSSNERLLQIRAVGFSRRYPGARDSAIVDPNRKGSRMKRNLAIVVAVNVLAACASSSSNPITTPQATASSAAPPPAETTVVGVTPAASFAAAAPADPPGVPADESNPPGINPLSDAEAQEAELKCTKLGRAIEKDVKAARKAGKNPYEAVLEALNSPPNVPGLDVPRCAELMRRDVMASQALNIESEAKNNLKAISVGLSAAYNQQPPVLCPSAPPVPPTLDLLRNGPWKADAASWEAPGWKCARFNLAGAPQYFQYELKTDAAAQTWEVVARGFPVAGQPATELYLRGRVENGHIQPSSRVMRRP